MGAYTKFLLAFILCVASVGFPVSSMSAAPKLGIVIMHGKGGSPYRLVNGLADSLEEKGYLVANIEMPWSGKRQYDVSVAKAEAEVEAVLAKLRADGAQKVFVAGHSQGGGFALYFAGKHTIDGVICIAPGGNVSNQIYIDKLGAYVSRARDQVAAGKGDEKITLFDFEGKRGAFPVETTSSVYLTWFDPEGAMNMDKAARALSPNVPILWLVPTKDYPGLRKTTAPMYSYFPKNPRSKMAEPDADHRGAPSASVDEIVKWTNDISASNR